MPDPLNQLEVVRKCAQAAVDAAWADYVRIMSAGDAAPEGSGVILAKAMRTLRITLQDADGHRKTYEYAATLQARIAKLPELRKIADEARAAFRAVDVELKELEKKHTEVYARSVGTSSTVANVGVDENELRRLRRASPWLWGVGPCPYPSTGLESSGLLAELAEAAESPGQALAAPADATPANVAAPESTQAATTSTPPAIVLEPAKSKSEANRRGSGRPAAEASATR